MISGPMIEAAAQNSTPAADAQACGFGAVGRIATAMP
jgi:hypothetical protein